MRRFLLTIPTLFFCCSALFAQFTEDFEGGIPGSWAIFDNGIGLSQSWTTNSTNCGGSLAAYNRYENVSGGNAIDFLVTPLITLDGGTPELTFDFREAFGSNFGSEYRVEVSTTSQTDPTSFTPVLTFPETASDPTTCTSKTVDLSTYAGQDVYIAFVHENDDGDNFYLDNVNIDGVSNACVPPIASFGVDNDCANSGGFFIEIAITDFGSATTIVASNSFDATMTTLNASNPSGILGPFANGTDVVVSLVPDDDDASSSCTVNSGTLTQESCPPANDECVDAIELVCNGGAIPGTTNASTDNADELGCGIGRAVWYTFTGTGADVTITVDDSGGTDLEISVATGACGGPFTNVTCQDDPEITTFNAQNGTVYYVAIGAWSNTSTSTGDFTIDLSCASCSNPEATFAVVDDCAVSGGFNLEATVDDLGSATSVTVSDGTTDQTVTLSGTMVAFGPYTNGTDVVLTVTNDQDGSCAISSGTLSQAACPPANDDCSDAIALTDANGMPTAANGSAYDSSSGTPSGVPDPECGGFTGDNPDDDLWFTITVPGGEGDIITVEADDIDGLPSVDLVLALYSGDCGSLVQVDCADGGNPETIVYTVPAARPDGASSSAAAETFYLRAFRYGAGGGEFTVTATVQSVLPVELTSFTGETMEKANKLSWATATEDGADRYLVERSATTNGSWTTIGEVTAAGNSTAEVTYELMDEQPLPSALYRLKMMDLDGSYEYSSIVQLDNAGLIGKDLSVFPVPTTDVVNVSFTADAAGTANIILTDLTGRTLSQQTVGVNAGLRTETVDLSAAKSGVYLVRVVVDGRQLVKRVVRQ